MNTNPDDWNIGDFGVIKEGTFDSAGWPTGWTLDQRFIHQRLPRWLIKESVLHLEEDGEYSVYIRGLFSDRLTKKRRKAVLNPTK